MPKLASESKVIKKFRYFCSGCTGRVVYAPQPFPITYEVCPKCAKVHDSSNYKEENWIAMSQEEIAEVNHL